MDKLDKQYWNQRYHNNETGWDLGSVSTPLKAYIDQLENKDLRILIPGCGNGYEAEYLFNKGFKNIYLIDLSAIALYNFLKRVPGFPAQNLVCNDFFEHHSRYDLILEQTFFCAIHPSKRPAYARKAAELLNSKGKIAGVLFDDLLNDDKPPFGGSREEYKTYFNTLFKPLVFETAYNSIPPRANRELFILLVKA